MNHRSSRNRNRRHELSRAGLPLVLGLIVGLGFACKSGGSPSAGEATTPGGGAESSTGQPLAEPPPENRAVATFAGGCFWCMEGPFEALDGVDEVISGYTGGEERNPVYEQVARGQTGHAEAVRVTYDPDVVTYDELLHVYWRQIDPTDAGGQFADRGTQYRPAIFVHDEAQRRAAEASKQALASDGPFDEPIVVSVEEAGDFWVAEEYHQNYYETHSSAYRLYRNGSGRTAFLREHWGDDAH